MNSVVIYRSKYGASARYARMLAETLGCECLDIQTLTPECLREYDPVIAGGGIYAGSVACASFLKKLHKRFPEKRLLVFAVGASTFDAQEAAKVRRQNFRDDLSEIPFVYCRGVYDESVMSWKDRTLCRMLRSALKKNPPQRPEPWAQALCEAEGKRCDWVDQRFLAPLFEILS